MPWESLTDGTPEEARLGRKEGWRGQRETAEYGAYREGRKLRPLRETQAAGLHTTTRFSRRSDFVGSFCTNGHAERKAGL
jgi:hypothetical protein